MKEGKLKRLLLAALVVIVVFAGAGALGLHFAVKALKAKVEQALGPESEVGEITLGWSAIEVSRVRIHAPKNWPAEDTLRARRIIIVPDLRGLLSAQVRINSITVEDGYISILRPKEGYLRLLPSLLEKPAENEDKAKSPAPPVTIGSVELKTAVLEFYDASVRKPPHKLRLEQLNASVENLRLPDLDGQTQLKLEGVIKGVKHDGKLAIQGWVKLANKDSEVTTKLRGVDLVALQPYLIKASETGVKRGTLDLDLKSTVHNNSMRAPGTLTLSQLELVSAGDKFGTFMGMPRQAVVAALKNSKGQITIRFTLEGNLKDPQFSLNESFAKRLGTSMAESLGVDIEGLARGAGSAAQGVGGAIGRLLGK